MSFKGRFRHTCQGNVYGTLVLWHDKYQCQKIMNQPYAVLTDATGKDQRFKAKSNGVVHGGRCGKSEKAGKWRALVEGKAVTKARALAINRC